VTKPITVPLDDYRIARASRHRFTVVAGHATEIDEVIYRGSDFEIVEIRPEHRRRGR
jgi:hypothetical protein